MIQALTARMMFGALVLGGISSVSIPTYAVENSVAQTTDRLYVDKFLDQYLKIQNALADDRLDGVSSSARSIAELARKSQTKEIADAATKLEHAKTLKEARSHFKALSAPIAKLTEKNKPQGVDVMYCPMAGAKWVQKQGEVSNPYYGKEMLSCGQKVS